MTKQGIPNISQISTFDENFPKILKGIMAKSTVSGNGDPEKFPAKIFTPKKYFRVEVQHGKDFTELLEECKVVIDWIYETNCRTKNQYYLPKRIKAHLDGSTIHGFLWLLARRNRQKIKPEPFAMIFNKYAERSGSMCVCIKEGISVPLPENIDEIDGQLRWLKIRKDTVEYTFAREIREEVKDEIKDDEE